jgi:hypothetical protein
MKEEPDCVQRAVVVVVAVEFAAVDDKVDKVVIVLTGTHVRLKLPVPIPRVPIGQEEMQIPR